MIPKALIPEAVLSSGMSFCCLKKEYLPSELLINIPPIIFEIFSEILRILGEGLGLDLGVVSLRKRS